MLRIVQILPLLTLGLSACQPPTERVGEVVIDEEALLVPFEVVGAGARADVPPPFEAAVRSATAWDTLRPRLRFTRPPAPVDFGGAMLLIVAADAPSSGHAVRVESVEHAPEGLHVEYVVLSPAADCITEGRPQVPFQVVRLRAIEAPVRFTAREEALKCTFDW